MDTPSMMYLLITIGKNKPQGTLNNQSQIYR